MTNIRTLIAAGAVLAVSFGEAVNAQEIYYPADQYGLVELTLPQSTAFRLESVLANNPNFERLGEYSPNDPLRRLSRSVGRLDILFASSGKMDNCTASVISPQYILTNAHCLSGKASLGPVSRASILMGYYAGEDGTQRYEVDTDPVETNAGLDYSILRVFGRPSTRWGTLPLLAADPENQTAMLLIHHPRGGPKHVTRGGCRSGDPATRGTELLHTCDTVGGSSGAPIISASDGAMLGLHFGGPIDPQPGEFNLGTRVTSLAAQSAIIRGLVRRPEPAEPPKVARANPDVLPTGSGEIVFWESIRGSQDPQVFRAYIDRYPNGVYVVLAEIRLADLEAARVSEPAPAPSVTATIAPQPDDAPTAAGNKVVSLAPPAPSVDAIPMSFEMLARTNVNVRTGPSTEAQRLGTIPSDRTVAVTGKVRNADWYRISYAGNDAFVYAPLLRPTTTPASGTLYAANRVTVRLRREPSNLSETIMTIPPDAAVAVLGRSQGRRWYFVTFAGKQGFVGWSLLGTQPPSNTTAAARETLYATSRGVTVNLRTEPSFLSEPLETVAPGDSVSVSGRSSDGNWLFVTYEGKQGYVRKWFLEDQPPGATTAATSTTRPPSGFKPSIAGGDAAIKAGDHGGALRHFLPLAQDGNAVAQRKLGIMYEQGRGVARDYGAALDLYRQAASQEDIEAKSLAGRLLVSGKVTRNYTEALRWFLQAAQRGDAAAQSGLGLLYSRGYGVRRNNAAALKWYRLAAEQDNVEAKTGLGFLYENGRGVTRSSREAVKWYLEAAIQGDPSAQYAVGKMLINGSGISRDYKKAIEWYRRAADLGDADALEALAAAYRWGNYGIPVDYVEAIRLYGLAAKQGGTNARYALQIVREQCNSPGAPLTCPGATPDATTITPDPVADSPHAPALKQALAALRQGDGRQALRIVNPLADQGIPGAQTLLGKMYELGVGVRGDNTRAVIWYKLATAQGDRDAKVALAKICQDRNVSGCP